MNSATEKESKMDNKAPENIAVNELLKPAPEKEAYASRDTDIDYVANGQLMVTITLAEYRQLVKKNADSMVNEANSKRYTVERERDELKKEVADLQKQLDDLKAMIARAVPMKTADNVGE